MAVKSKKRKKKFLEVDVWKSEFGPIAVKAIYSIFFDKFNVEQHNMRKYSFSRCVNGLRRLEDSTYEEPSDIISW